MGILNFKASKTDFPRGVLPYRAAPIMPPDIKGRLQILEVYGRKLVMAEQVRLQDVAATTPGFTGADTFTYVANDGGGQVSSMYLDDVALWVLAQSLLPTPTPTLGTPLPEETPTETPTPTETLIPTETATLAGG